MQHRTSAYQNCLFKPSKTVQLHVPTIRRQPSAFVRYADILRITRTDTGLPRTESTDIASARFLLRPTHMSRPRPVVPNTTAMVTKRVHKRQMLLVEDAMVTQIVEYTLAYCVNKFDGIEVHALILEGNHIHRIDTAEHPNRPDFNRDFHSLLTRQLNTYYGEADALWSSKQTNVVINETPEDVVERIVYAMGNPVADGIVRHGKDYAGMRVRWPMPAKTVKRPDLYWRTTDQGGPGAEELQLEFTRPPGYEELSDDEFDAHIEERVQAYEEQKRKERDIKGVPFRCDVTQEPVDPRSYPRTKHTLFRLAPFVGAKLKKLRIAAIQRLHTFRAQHAQARERHLEGDQDVVFPAGTFLAVRRWNVRVAPA